MTARFISGPIIWGCDHCLEQFPKHHLAEQHVKEMNHGKVALVSYEVRREGY